MKNNYARQRSINFTIEQDKFIKESETFNLQKFCRDALQEYMESRKLMKELENGS